MGKDAVKQTQLWAPWRLGYILGEKDSEPAAEGLSFLPGADRECFLCQAVADAGNRCRHVVHHNQRVITVLNRYPYNNGHLLVAPRSHHGRLDHLDANDHIAIGEELTRMVEVLDQVLSPEGFNIGLNLGRVAGAGLPDHLHWHIVPRWNGDTNFMPALAAVKVIPQSLDALWEALTDEVAKRGL